MIVGFTGTRHGMSREQMRIFGLMVAREQWRQFHHGDCIGADAQAHYLVREAWPRCRIHVHPMRDAGNGRAYMAGDVVYEPALAIHRNHEIVDKCDWLIAAPQTVDEVLRSGTWATIRYARSIGRSLTILYP